MIKSLEFSCTWKDLGSVGEGRIGISLLEYNATRSTWSRVKHFDLFGNASNKWRNEHIILTPENTNNFFSVMKTFHYLQVFRTTGNRGSIQLFVKDFKMTIDWGSGSPFGHYSFAQKLTIDSHVPAPGYENYRRVAAVASGYHTFASTVYHDNYGEYSCQLDCSKHWAAAQLNDEQWIGVNLIRPRHVFAVETQGSTDDSWVTKFTV